MEAALALVCGVAGDLRLTCSALCVSKGASALILGMCSHSLTVSLGSLLFDGNEALLSACQQGYWVAKYGPLVRELKLKVFSLRHAGEAVVCLTVGQQSALQQQAATHLFSLTLSNGVQQFSTTGACALQSSPRGLKQLSVCTVTYLPTDAALFEGLCPHMQHISLAGSNTSAAGHQQQQLQLKLDISSPSPAAAVPAAVQQHGCTQSVQLSYLPGGAANTSSGQQQQHLTSYLQKLVLEPPGCGAEVAEAADAAASGLPFTVNNLEQQQPDPMDVDSHPDNAEAAAAAANLHRVSNASDAQGEEADDSSIAAPAWASLTNLQSMDLKGETTLSAAVAAGIAGATSLTKLRVRVTDMEQGVNPVTMLQPLKQLQQLSLVATQPHSRINSFGRLFATEHTQLTSLQLAWPKMRLLALTQVYNMTNLQQLLLSCEDIGDQGVQVIANNMGQLHVLGLSNCNVSVAGMVEVLSSQCMPHLQQLVVADVGFEGAADALRAARPGVYVAGYSSESGMADRLDECVMPAV